MEVSPTPTPTPSSVTTVVDGVVVVSLEPSQLYALLFLGTLAVGVSLIRLFRSYATPFRLS